MSTTEYVTRYVVVSDTGDMASPFRQGRYTFATEAEAQEHLEAMMTNNSRETLASIWKLPLHVSTIECYPGHFDPRGHSALWHERFDASELGQYLKNNP